MKVLNIDEVEGEKLGESTIRRILVYSKNLMLMYTEAEPGGPPIAHSHPHEQMGFIIQGTSELTAGGKTVTLRAGSSFLIEPNEYHEIRSVGDEKIKVLDIFHPYREDYVSKKQRLT
jgi:quercetin dioxygenase-like cupin family protein